MIKEFKIPNVVFKIREGDSVPLEGACAIGGKWTDETTNDYFKGKRVVLFSLPGAFTPTCSSQQVPGFEKQTSTPPLIKVSNILSAPFIVDHSHDDSSVVLIVKLFCFTSKFHETPSPEPVAFAQIRTRGQPDHPLHPPQRRCHDRKPNGLKARFQQRQYR